MTQNVIQIEQDLSDFFTGARPAADATTGIFPRETNAAMSGKEPTHMAQHVESVQKDIITNMGERGCKSPNRLNGWRRAVTNMTMAGTAVAGAFGLSSCAAVDPVPQSMGQPEVTPIASETMPVIPEYNPASAEYDPAVTPENREALLESLRLPAEYKNDPVKVADWVAEIWTRWDMAGCTSEQSKDLINSGKMATPETFKESALAIASVNNSVYAEAAYSKNPNLQSKLIEEDIRTQPEMNANNIMRCAGTSETWLAPTKYIFYYDASGVKLSTVPSKSSADAVAIDFVLTGHTNAAEASPGPRDYINDVDRVNGVHNTYRVEVDDTDGDGFLEMRDVVKE